MRLFNFFGFEKSVLAGSDRYLDKILFLSKLNQIMEYQYQENERLLEEERLKKEAKKKKNKNKVKEGEKEEKKEEKKEGKKEENSDRKDIKIENNGEKEEGNSNVKEEKTVISSPDPILITEQIKEQKQREKTRRMLLEFICNILCGYDEDKNIRDDSISYNLLRKKIGSNLKFLFGEKYALDENAEFQEEGEEEENVENEQNVGGEKMGGEN